MTNLTDRDTGSTKYGFKISITISGNSRRNPSVNPLYDSRQHRTTLVNASLNFCLVEVWALQLEDVVDMSITRARKAPDRLQIVDFDIHTFRINDVFPDMDIDYFADDHGMARAQPQSPMKFALEMNGRFGDARHRNFDGWRFGKARQFDLVDIAGNIAGTDIHSFSDFFTHDMGDEFRIRFNVLNRILKRTVFLIAGAKHHHWRLGPDHIEHTERGGSVLSCRGIVRGNRVLDHGVGLSVGLD